MSGINIEQELIRKLNKAESKIKNLENNIRSLETELESAFEREKDLQDMLKNSAPSNSGKINVEKEDDLLKELEEIYRSNALKNKEISNYIVDISKLNLQLSRSEKRIEEINQENINNKKLLDEKIIKWESKVLRLSQKLSSLNCTTQLENLEFQFLKIYSQLSYIKESYKNQTYNNGSFCIGKAHGLW